MKPMRRNSWTNRNLYVEIPLSWTGKVPTRWPAPRPTPTAPKPDHFFLEAGSPGPVPWRAPPPPSPPPPAGSTVVAQGHHDESVTGGQCAARGRQHDGFLLSPRPRGRRCRVLQEGRSSCMVSPRTPLLTCSRLVCSRRFAGRSLPSRHAWLLSTCATESHIDMRNAMSSLCHCCWVRQRRLHRVLEGRFDHRRV